jgi:hypothetical protein
MRNQIIFFLMTLGFVAISSATYNLNPLGIQSSITGNVGLAQIDSEDAAAYNPASVAESQYSKFSASGSFIGYSKFNVNNDSNFLDKTKDGSLSINSGYLSSLTRFETFNLGFFAYNRQNYNVDKYLALTASGVTGDISTKGTVSSQRIGGLLSGIVSDSFLIGMTMHVDINSFDSQTNTKAFYSFDNSVSTSYKELHSKVMILGLKLGGLFKIDDYIISFIYEPSGWQLSQDQYRNEATTSTNGTFKDNSLVQDSDEKSSQSFGLGFSFKTSSVLKWLFEVKYTEGIKFKKSLTSNSLPALFVFGAGFNYDLDKTKKIFSGLTISAQTYPDEETRNSLTKYISAGLKQKISFLNSSVGIYYSDLTEKISKEESSRKAIENYGFIMGTSYEY